jgi:hypothetical protein
MVLPILATAKAGRGSLPKLERRPSPVRRTVLVFVVVLLLVVASVLLTGFVVACSRRNHRSSAGSVDPAAPVSDLGGSE